MAKRFPEILQHPKYNDRHVDFRAALFSLDKSMIEEEHLACLFQIYTNTKQLDSRNKILKLLYDLDYEPLHAFFEMAYKKERYLDMKIYALRGLSQFAQEKELDKILQKFRQTLAKRQETTPYNYQEYELLKGKNALPYLVDKYQYACLRETLAQVNSQYEAMPDAFKGHFTTDEQGEIVQLRKPEESNRILTEFWAKERK